MTRTAVAIGRDASYKEIVELMQQWQVSAVPVLGGRGPRRRRPRPLPLPSGARPGPVAHAVLHHAAAPRGRRRPRPTARNEGRSGHDAPHCRRGHDA
ncbi:hypothetical protein [Streptomyces sp. NPDC058092]|uniref:hypothetical protein n=1 Tax=Streptomyces sp. NPDC058092 TaxID=3346336 RepID=UPI0036E64248